MRHYADTLVGDCLEKKGTLPKGPRKKKACLDSQGREGGKQLISLENPVFVANNSEDPLYTDPQSSLHEKLSCNDSPQETRVTLVRTNKS